MTIYLKGVIHGISETPPWTLQSLCSQFHFFLVESNIIQGLLCLNYQGLLSFLFLEKELKPNNPFFFYLFFHSCFVRNWMFNVSLTIDSGIDTLQLIRGSGSYPRQYKAAFFYCFCTYVLVKPSYSIISWLWHTHWNGF